MGQGRGGYVSIQQKGSCYVDSGGNKVTDKNSIFVAERYIDEGDEAVFRKVKGEEGKMYDLTIKSGDDREFIKNIEVKGVESPNPSKMATNIKEAFFQVGDAPNATVAIRLLHHKNDEEGRKFAREGFEEAKRKGDVKGHVEVWFSDKTKLDMN